jgi:S1-C subfamily serine protease
MTPRPLPPPSSAAQKLYAAAKADLLQVRSLLKSGRTQSSVGSGFLVGTSNLVLTNYHVVSQFALDPETYTGEWVDTGGQRGNGRTAGGRRAARPGRGARQPQRHRLFQDARTRCA